MTRLHVAATRYPGETRAVLFDSDDNCVEVRVFRGSPETTEGALWHGRVVGRVSGAKALMVDVGGAEPGLLPFKEIPGGQSLNEGNYVLVGIERQARAEKGPRLTAKVRLPSPYLIYSPYRKGVAVSRRLSTEVAGRLQNWAEDGVELGEGWVVRGAAEACDASVLDAARADLRAEYQKLTDVQSSVRCVRPAPDPFAEWLSEIPEDIASVSVTGASVLAAARSILSSDQVSVSLTDAFAAAGGEDALGEALSPEVALPGGGAMTLEATRAFWAVDVDTNGVKGPQAAEYCNDAAVKALASEMRRRNIGGALVMDVVPEGNGKSAVPAAKRLLKPLRAAVSDDPRVQVYGASPMGHLELVRARRGLSLFEAVHGDTLGVGGAVAETTALSALQEAVQRVRDGDVAALTMRVSAAAMGWMNGAGRYAVAEAEAMLGQSLQKEVSE